MDALFKAPIIVLVMLIEWIHKIKEVVELFAFQILN
jgi:hypothetical protein